MIQFRDLGAENREVDAALRRAFSRVLQSGRYIRGSEVEKFEAEFARYVGAKHCVGVGNGLDALTIALVAAGIEKGQEVIVAANAYWATWLAIERTGATVVPVDPDPDHGNITADGVRAAITKRTSAVMALHLYGHPVEEAVFRLAEQKGLFVLEDAAHSHGAKIGRRRVGSLGDAAGFSMYPTKNLGALGDAGVITFRDGRLGQRARQIAHYGAGRHPGIFWRFGVNSRLDEMQAAFLRAKMFILPEWQRQRADLAGYYMANLPHRGWLSHPYPAEWATPAWHLFVVHAKRRDRVQAALTVNGVESMIHYPVPPYAQKPYEGRFKAGQFPIADQLARECLSLPFYPQMPRGHIRVVCQILKELSI